MTRASLAVFVALGMLLSAAPATAQAPQTNAPPGNSAIDEYLETVPSSVGNARPRPSATQGDGGSDAVLSAAQRARLERIGPDGKTLADAVDSTAPAEPAPAKPQIEVLGERDGRAPFGEVLRTVGDGGGGMGLVLPAILLGTVLAAVAAVLLRRREAS